MQGNWLLIGGIGIRLLLIIYGEWQDQNMLVKYTDIDFMVFTDGARYVSQGQSPYERSTFRYTPLLAYLLLPGIYFHPIFGKLLFAIADIAIGELLRKILSFTDKNKNNDLLVAAWYFNPISINVSTRGNAESLVSFLVLLSLYLLLRNRIFLGSIIFGLAVHLKIYPLIYAFPLLFYIDSNKVSSIFTLTNNRLKFAFVSASAFLLTTFWMYTIYGYEFLYHTYLYHLIRTDPRHNFSVYFYFLYLSSVSESSWLLRISGILAFVPQILVTFAFFTQKYYKDITFCMFLQTLAFVAFNKVCTVQYFIWYFALLPLAVGGMKGGLLFKAALFAVWFAPQLLWLGFAYQLEFLALNTFFKIWASGILFFAANVFIILFFIMSHSKSKSSNKIQ